MTKEIPISNVQINAQSRSLGIGNWSLIGHWSLVIGHSIGHSPKPIVRLPARKTRWLAGGFTLIELILVMALLAIVLAVSAPSLSKFFRGRTLASEGRRFVSLTRYGQSRAVSEGVPMMLWIDTRRGAYGLEQEPGYTDLDTKAVQFVLTNRMRMAVRDVPLLTGQTMQARQTAQADPSVPRLHFQPDGFISEDSAQTVEIQETTGETLWITQSRNRLNYEIGSEASQNSLRRR